MAYNRRKRKVKKNIPEAVAHIKSTYNNTIVTITDKEGNVISWASAGTIGCNHSTIRKKAFLFWLMKREKRSRLIFNVSPLILIKLKFILVRSFLFVSVFSPLHCYRSTKFSIDYQKSNTQ